MPTEWVGLIGGILGVVGVVSAALVIVKSKIATTTIELLNQNQAALKSRIETLEAENYLLRQRVQALEHTKDELFEQVKSLPAFVEITDILDNVKITLDKVERVLRND